ncbi:MAG TPA: DNA polymerase III subunit beta [Spirochaetales bacterium]|nr:DNA polymerase III subunit beta [Spirochaetales bacterium]HRY53847.1 DNA polymerase III subunit beta [Spirochaetia bacterium]
MKFTCEKNAFAREISFAQEIIASKNALSIMSNVLLEAQEGSLSIKATDIKVSFETTIPVDTSEPGSITVFCDKLSGILSSIPEGDIAIEQDDSKVVVKPTFKKVRFQLKTISSEKFPELPAAPEEAFFSIPAKEFKEMISQTVFAVSDDETRYFMNGVYMERVEGGLVLVATDGRRLSYVKREFDAVIPEFKGIIVPPKVLSLVQKRAPDEGLVELAVTDKSLFLRFGSYRVSSVLIEGQFPNYQKVIPESQKNSVSLKRSDLLDALRRVSIFVEQKSRRTFFGLSNGSLVLSSEESEIGTAREELPCAYEGPEATIALNYKYVEEPLKVIDTEDILIEFTEPNRAITVSPSPRSDYFHIVMPMQIE